MRVRLQTPHYITDRVWPVDTEMDLPPGVRPTPQMVGLDDEAVEAIKAEKIEVFGRWIRKGHHWVLLDDPPLERPLEENQPVEPVPSGGPR